MVREDLYLIGASIIVPIYVQVVHCVDNLYNSTVGNPTALGSTTATDNENTVKQLTNLQFDIKTMIKH